MKQNIIKQNIIKLTCAIAAALLFFITLPAAYKYNQYKSDFHRAIIRVHNEKYDEAINSFYDLMKTDLGKKNSSKIEKEINKAKSFKVNKSLYDEGLRQLTDKKYLEAIDYFKKISKDDSKRYEMAKSKIDDCKSLYTSLNIGNAKNMAKQYHFDEATGFIDLVLKLDESNKEAITLKSEYTKAKEAAEALVKEVGFEFDAEEDSIRIIRCLKDGKDITIPEQIDGKTVRIIGGEAFNRFFDMVSLTLPQSLTTIEEGVFYRCFSLENITIPKNVEQIGSDPFFLCISLTNIFVDPENKYYTDLDGVLYNKDRTVLLVYPEGRTNEGYTIPSTVKKIDDYAFGHGCNSLKSITIPSSVVEFPDYNMFTFPDEIALRVKAGSVAEKYAWKFELKYKIY